MCGSMVDIQSPTAEIRRVKKEEETTGCKYIWPALLHRAAIITEFHIPNRKYTDYALCSLYLVVTCIQVLQNPTDVLPQPATSASMPIIGRRICVHTVVENCDVEARNVHSR